MRLGPSLLIGVATACGADVSNGPNAERQVPLTEPPASPSDVVPAPTTISDPGELTAALIALGVDVEQAPQEVLAMSQASYCGLEVRDNLRTLGESINEPARRCFLDHSLVARAAVFVESLRSVEGDPVVYVWFVGPEGTTGGYVDATRDHFGSGTWEKVSCPEITANFPHAPEPLPASYFTCNDTNDIPVLPRPVVAADSFPWFDDRDSLPLCGYELHSVEPLARHRQCFSSAVADGQAAEFVNVTYSDSDGWSVWWFRSISRGRIEVVRWMPGQSGAGGTWRWYRCTGLDFTDNPGGIEHGLPVLSTDDCASAY